MEALLTPVRTSYKSLGQDSEDLLTKVHEPKTRQEPILSSTPRIPELPVEALEILRNEPSYGDLISTLKYLQKDDATFCITSPGPLAAQLVQVLVTVTVPTYWNVLRVSQKSKKPHKRGRTSNTELLLSCLRSVTGLNAILLSLKQLIQRSKQAKKTVSGSNTQEILTALLEVLSALLEGDDTVEIIAKSIWKYSDDPLKQKPLWTEFLSIYGGGKVLSLSAEAEDAVNELSKDVKERYWISYGSLYCRWLARNIAHWAQAMPSEPESAWKNCVELLSKSFRLGYTEILIKEIITTLVLDREDSSKTLKKFLDSLPSFEQKNFLLASLNFISKEYLSSMVTSEDDSRWWRSDTEIISSASGLLNLILAKDEARTSQLIIWLTGASGAGAGDSIAIRRAAVAAIAGDKTHMATVLEKSLRQFGDQLYIRHTPIIQQEVHAQVLLLAAGYVCRAAPTRFAMTIRSGSHLNVVSNRLSASSPRARFLGMVVGEALSSLVDTGDKQMDFKVEEMSSPEARWYKSLVTVSDSVGSLKELKLRQTAMSVKKRQPQASKKPKPSKALQGGSKIIAIEHLSDKSEDLESDDGLVPYEKPDSDRDDSDGDPTLVTRNKPTAPVYIRDLIVCIRDTESYDKQKIALEIAASLIRRKANFGTEVTSHSEELASLLVGWQDKYDIGNFQEMRLQGMIAVLIAQPLKMGQWFSKTFFDGDYSLSQRATVLTTLGLGARELGGLGNENEDPPSENSLPSSTFPSKALPENMHKLYASSPSEVSPVDKLSAQLSNTMIAPMAAELADKITGPSILKVRTFSSRMAIEKKRKKPIANTLAKVVADGFFFPLTGRFFIHLKAYGSSKSNLIFHPYLLTLFLKTLSLLLHASGPSTLSLPQMTSEFWDLLLSLRTQSIGDITITEALLFAFMMILEINEDQRRLVDAHGRQLLETQEWVEGIFGQIGAGGSEEDERVRMLAAGCLVRIREVVENYQGLLMGDMASFQH